MVTNQGLLIFVINNPWPGTDILLMLTQLLAISFRDVTQPAEIRFRRMRIL